jgi:hypothetical protein
MHPSSGIAIASAPLEDLAMKSDPIRGKTIQWTFSDGPMANRTFEHAFKDDGSVSFRPLDGKGEGKATEVKKYEIATLGPDVYAASYLGPSGYTLTAVLDYRSGKVVAFASNEKDLVLQHGTFREVEAAKNGARTTEIPPHAARR